MRVPALLACGMLGNREGGGEQILDWGAHGLEIGRRSLTEKGAPAEASAHWPKAMRPSLCCPEI